MSSNNAPALMRSLIVYAICIPLAIFLGYSLTNITDQTLYLAVILVGLMVLPLVLKFHYPLLLFSWHAPITLFFIKSSPNLWLLAVLVSLSVSFVERILARETHYISVPSITWPLIVFVGVVLVTAQLTGGLGLRTMGSEVYGGKKYVFLIIGILSYFALVSRPIPLEKARRYTMFFILGAMMCAIGDTFQFAPSWLTPVYYVFPPTIDLTESFELGVTRLSGTGICGLSLFGWLIAKHGLRGIFLSGKPGRIVLLLLAFCLGTMGGFRTTLFTMMAIFMGAFFVEKLYQTWLIAPAILGSIFLALIIIPTAHHLPFTVQRAMAFLPLDLNQEAVAAAQSSTDWRFSMWSGLMEHEVPDHLWKGKGYGFSKEDYDEMMGQTLMARSAHDVDQQGLALAGDYHNGMLSLVIPFGVWGVLAFSWFMIAGLRVVYLNLKYGRPELRTINYYLFIMYFIEFASYVSCLGGLGVSGDVAWFLGYLGMSVALNHGVCRKPFEQRQNLPENAPVSMPALAPSNLNTGLRT